MGRLEPKKVESPGGPMRTSLPLVLALFCVLALASGVRGEDPQPASLDASLELLTRHVAYLRGREARLTSYIVANGARAEALEKLVVELREGGFAAGANPSQARERLLKGLSDMAESLKAGLPTITDTDRAALAAFPR
jgi:hypothetical protein